MAKFFAVIIILIAIGSAVPIVRGTWVQPPDISAHGPEIDRQYHETMWEAGLAFLAAQIILAGFIWSFSNRPDHAEIRRFPGGATGLVLAAILLVGTEVLALGVFGVRAWANVYFAPPGAGAMPVQVQAGQFAFYFRYPGPDGKFGPLHPDKINEANENFFGLDTAADPESKDDIVTAELAIPVNQEIHLLMHAKDVGHSFYVRELRVQQDFVPGLDVSVHFTPTQVGKYEIVCTQLCGLGHYNMKTYVEVMTQPDFEAWLKQQAALQ